MAIGGAQPRVPRSRFGPRLFVALTDCRQLLLESSSFERRRERLLWRVRADRI